jgi:hypothetical protein
VKGAEFLRKLKKLGKENEVSVSYEPAHGKGSHGRLSYGENHTTVKDLKKELGPGLLHSMCQDLGIDLKDL